MKIEECTTRRYDGISNYPYHNDGEGMPFALLIDTQAGWGLNIDGRRILNHERQIRDLHAFLGGVIAKNK
jgi:hypothetical protein